MHYRFWGLLDSCLAANELNQENQRLRAALEASEQARQTAEQESVELPRRQNPAVMENQNPERYSNLGGINTTEAAEKRMKLLQRQDACTAEQEAIWAEMGYYD